MSSGSRRGHPITAWSAVNSLGADLAEINAKLRAGGPAFSAPPPETPFQTVCGTVSCELPPLPEALRELESRNNRFVHRALSAMRGAIERAREHWGPLRVGICVGTSTAAMDEAERAHAIYLARGGLPPGFDVIRQAGPDGLLRALRGLTGIEGPAIAISNACASSGKVFASARRWLESGAVDAVLVGGADSLCQTTLRGFRALGLLSEELARPFSSDRRGIHIGEGAAFALIERCGEGPRLLGAGESSDAHHMSTPDPEGRGALLAMQLALADAGIAPRDVGYVNAHGTGTRNNDSMEAHALEALFGDLRPVIVSTKGLVGHTLGAAGAIEAVFTLEALRAGWTPASAGAEPVDPSFAIDVAVEPRSLELAVGLSNSFAFGGSNVSVVFGIAE